MPTYEYRCKHCGERVEIWATMSEKERGLHPHCPKCGSTDMAYTWGGFVATSSRGKTTPGHTHTPSCGCGGGSCSL